MSKRFLFLIFQFIVVFNISAQNVRFISYNNSNNGLTNDLVKAICQDSLGFIWIATDDGLSRFDGISFQNFTDNLPSKYIKSIIKTKSGRILATTDGGLLEIISKPDTSIINLVIPGTGEQTDTSLHWAKLLFEDSSGNVWITDDMSVMLLQENNKFKRYTFNENVKSTSYHRTFVLVENSYGNLFAFSQNGYTFYFDKQSDKFVELSGLDKFVNVSYAIASSNGKILVATSDGIYELKTDENNQIISVKNSIPEIDASYIIKKDDNSFVASTWGNGIFEIILVDEKYEHNKFAAFPFDRTNFLFSDVNGNIFVGTDAGIVLMQFTFFSANADAISQNYILSINLSNQNKAWISVGSSIYKAEYTSKELLLEQFEVPQIQGSYTNVFPSKNIENSFWLSTNSGFIYFMKDGKIEKTFDFTDTGRSFPHCFEDFDGNLWAVLDGFNGVIKITKDFQTVKYDSIKGIRNQFIIIKQRSDGAIFGGASTVSDYLYKYDSVNDKFVNISCNLNFEPKMELYINDLAFEGQNIWMATSDGILKQTDTVVQRIDLGEYTKNMAYSITSDKNGNIWFANNKGIFKYSDNSLSFFNQNQGLSTITASYCCFFSDSLNHLWLGTALGLNFSGNSEENRVTTVPVITKVLVNNSKIPDFNNGFSFIQGSFLTINFVPVSFPGSEVSYQYKISDENWIELNYKTELILPNLPSGNYIIQIRAKQQGNYVWSESCYLAFKILPPWYIRWWAILLYLISAVLLIYIIVTLNNKRLRDANIRLEKIVKERTNEVVTKNTVLEQQKEEIQAQNEILLQQKEEITSQRDEIEKQKEEITSQRDEIEQKRNLLQFQNQSITNSITYARRIQNAVLPSEELFSTMFSENFIVFKPRDIVSGDFYYIKQISNFNLIAVADCTGHGVPGAFMSMLGIAILNEIVRKADLFSAAYILDELRNQLKNSLNQTGQKGEQQDGMDMGLCIINSQNLEMSFAGAYIPLFLIKNKEKLSNSSDELKFNIFNPDRQPIGIFPIEKPFTNYSIQLVKDDIFYFFTDGFISQFGGENNEKMKSKKFHDLILKNCNKPLSIQKTILENEFELWKNNYEQTDDVLVVGFKI